MTNTSTASTKSLTRLISDTQDLHDQLRALNAISLDIAIYNALAAESIRSRLRQTYRSTPERQSAETQKRHLDSIDDPVYLRENGGFRQLVRLLERHRADFSKLQVPRGTLLRKNTTCPETPREKIVVTMQMDLLDFAVTVINAARKAVEIVEEKHYKVVLSQRSTERRRGSLTSLRK